MNNRKFFYLFYVFVICLFGVFSCAPNKNFRPIDNNLVVGIAPFSQPSSSKDLLAGYSSSDVKPVNESVLLDLDELFASMLAKNINKSYVNSATAALCRTALKKDNNFKNLSALKKWSAIGRCMKVDLLVVPYLIDWRERDGGSVGVEVPAKVVMDFYVVDVRNEAVISRSHYDVTQQALTSNLLEVKSFFKRGAKWVKAEELAKEGMDEAIKEFGL